MQAADDDLAAPHRPFRKVFIDNGLAFLRARQGRHQEALDLCQSGYELLTNKMGEDRHRLHRSILLYNIAQVYVMLGRLDNGLEHYRKAIAMDPNYSEYHNEVGNILQEQSRHREAIACYEQAIRCSAPYPEVFFNKAVCHARLEEQADALVCFDMTLELNPQHSEAHALRADTCRELGNAAAALAGYDTAIAMGYEAVAVRINRAVLHYNNGCFDLALADMDHVITLDPQEAGHYEPCGDLPGDEPIRSVLARYGPGGPVPRGGIIMEAVRSPVFGPSMDSPISKGGLARSTLMGLAVAASVLVVVAWLMLNPAARTLAVERSKITISTVTSAPFRDFIPLRGQVVPLESIALDAVQGGRVEEVLAEVGQRVVSGQKLIRLSDPTLELDAIARETQVIRRSTASNHSSLPSS